MLTMTKKEFEDMLERAARAGAAEALNDIGLGDKTAEKDLEELRTLLSAWRTAKETAWLTIVKFFVMLMLSLMAAGVYFKIK